MASPEREGNKDGEAGMEAIRSLGPDDMQLTYNKTVLSE